MVGSISFFVNAGIRFIEEICKLRAFTELWDRIGLDRYGVTGPQAAALPLRRAGEQPRAHRGPAREQRPAHRAGDAGRHPVQAGPGPLDPAAGLERGARAAPAVGSAVVVADATSAGLRDRPPRVRRHLRRLARDRGPHARAGRRRLRRARRRARPGRRVRGHRRAEGPPGAVPGRADPAHRVAATRSSWASTASPRRRRHRSVGRRRSCVVDPAVEAELVADVAGVARRTGRGPRWPRRSTSCGRGGRDGENVMPATIALAHAGGTTGEWADALREVFGEFRAPDRRRRPPVGGPHGELAEVAGAGPGHGRRAAPPARRQARARRPLERRRADRRRGPRRRHGGRVLGHPPHAGADRGVGPRRGSRRRRPVDPVRQPPHPRAPRSSGCSRAEGVDAPVVVGGIIPEEDRARLTAEGVAAVYTPKDFELGRIMDDIVDLGRGAPRPAADADCGREAQVVRRRRAGGGRGPGGGRRRRTRRAAGS